MPPPPTPDGPPRAVLLNRDGTLVHCGSAHPGPGSGHGLGYGPGLLDELTREVVLHWEAPGGR